MKGNVWLHIESWVLAQYPWIKIRHQSQTAWPWYKHTFNIMLLYNKSTVQNRKRESWSTRPTLCMWKVTHYNNIPSVYAVMLVHYNAYNFDNDCDIIGTLSMRLSTRFRRLVLACLIFCFYDIVLLLLHNDIILPTVGFKLGNTEELQSICDTAGRWQHSLYPRTDLFTT